MEIAEIVIVVLSALGGIIVGFVGGQVDALKAHVAATPNKVDDAALALAERIAARVVSAKNEDPAKPLGES